MASPPAPGAGESRSTALYRAALGPWNADKYLAAFARFDAAGRRSLQWHAPAALLGLVWLVFRRLWVAALAYACVALILGVLIGWQWPLIRMWPPGVQAGVWLSLMLVHLLTPGMTAYALMHAQVQKRVLRAVAAARSLDEACAMLARQAPTRAWLRAVVIASGMSVAACLWAWMNWSTTAALPQPVPQAEPAVPRVAEPPTAVPTQEPEAASVVAVEAPGPVEDAQAVRSPVETEVPPPMPMADTPAQAVASEEPAAAVPELHGGYGINVGLFADPANAQRAYQALLDEGLPATQQTVPSARGSRTRVRAGPFTSREQADAAAQRIRQLGLEAVVFSR